MRETSQFWTVLLALILLHAGWAYGSDAPRIAYSDLISGPASGGENNQGAIVTLSGSGFGAARGSSQVSLAGVPVMRILEWSDHRIAFQVGSNARSGDIRVTIDQQGSNTAPFTIVKGKIFFVSPTGRDGASGQWHSPWKSIPYAIARMRPGDITYVLDGVRQTGVDSYNAALSIATSGIKDRPIALVAYPGATAVIGNQAGPEFGIRTPSIRGGPFNDWVLAGFTLRGANNALRLTLVSRWRVVNNDISCPGGDGAAGCVEISGSSSIFFLGNTVHDTGRPGASKKYQSVYFTTDSNHIDVGWNRILHNQSCRGIQFHSSPASADSGFNQYDLLIHDNEISGQACDGINLATIDPSKGRIELYNNLIFHVGLGPAPPDGQSSYTCINSPGIVNRGTSGTGYVEIYNNTLSDCGTMGGPSAGAFYIGSNSPDLILIDNIIDQHGLPYFAAKSALNKLHGSANLWAGDGPGPRETSGNIAGDPAFSTEQNRFGLSARSPAKHASNICPVRYDLAGKTRHQIAGCSLGAFD